jgi:hypothetical protein
MPPKQSTIAKMRTLVSTLTPELKYKLSQIFILKDDMKSFWMLELIRDDSKYPIEEIEEELTRLGVIR